MYQNKIFSIDGTFRFGAICISSDDIEFGTVPMQIVDALVRRARDQAPFFVQLAKEGPDWILAYLENCSWGNSRFMMYEENGCAERIEMSYVRDVSLQDFAERVVFDLSKNEMSAVYSPDIGPGRAYFRWEDLQCKVSELKLLMENEQMFNPIAPGSLCGFEVQVGVTPPIQLGNPIYENGKRIGWEASEADVTKAEEYLNSCYLKSVQRKDGWFLIKESGSVIDGPYVAQSCVQDVGMIYLSEFCDKYREKEEQDCNQELESNWSGEIKKIIEMRKRGFKSKVILGVLDLLKTVKPAIKS